jgi:hypothetical protein
MGAAYPIAMIALTWDHLRRLPPVVMGLYAAAVAISFLVTALFRGWISRNRDLVEKGLGKSFWLYLLFYFGMQAAFVRQWGILVFISIVALQYAWLGAHYGGYFWLYSSPEEPLDWGVEEQAEMPVEEPGPRFELK